ncbi:eukaryotic translation initiation factor 4 gamma 3-like isoform X2 [Ylistrum balloti]|uniref:eukaryotic translation initiation factor 4 gamma 3-like isoform X2 n=1 Tax=Ylistrum balloti TaxID=509963 RepID=UPI002905EB2D|nr:eukaryotic translation initiation factor 4 gamma 3-like isoform X2 [Ylistrum balloti]
MNVQKVKPPVSAAVQLPGHSQPRNIVPSRVTTPPVHRGPEEQVTQQYSSYPQGIVNISYPNQYLIPQQQQQQQQPQQQPQQQTQSNPHELDKGQLTTSQTFGGQRTPGTIQQNMYQNPTPGMRGAPPPFFSGQTQPRQTRYTGPPPISQPPNQPMYQTMYMAPNHQPGTFQPPGGTPIIVQPQLSMMVGNRMNTPQFAMQTSQQGMTGMTYPMAANQTANQQFNPITVYHQQPTQSQRPPSGGMVTQQTAQQSKREKHMIKIVDPNTGKDISSEILNTPRPGRSTTPGSSPSPGAIAQGEAVSESESSPFVESPPPPSESPNGHQGDIAAVFAAQVAATLKPETPAEPPGLSSKLSHDVPSFTPAEIFAPVSASSEEVPEESHSPVEAVVSETDTPVISPPVKEATTTVLAEVSIESGEVSNSVRSVTIESNPSLSNTNNSVPATQGETALVSDSGVDVQSVSSQEPSDSSVVDSMKSENQNVVVVDEVVTPVEPPTPSDSDCKPDIVATLSDNPRTKDLVNVEVEETLDSNTSKQEDLSDKDKVPNVFQTNTTGLEDSNPVSSVKKDTKGKKKGKEANKKGEESKKTDEDVFLEPQPVEPSAPLPEPVEVLPKTVPETQEMENNTEKEEKMQQVEVQIQDKVQEENQKNEEKSKDVKENVKNSESTEKEKQVMETRYKYKEDQWSPMNPEGKRLYDRDFLLQMQYAGDSTTKPVGLPDLPDIILDKPHYIQPSGGGGSGGSGGGGGRGPPFSRDPQSFTGSFDFTPGYVRSPRVGGGSDRGGGRMTKSGSNQGRKIGGPPQRIITHVSIGQDVTLHKAGDAWKPQKSTDKVEDPEDKKTEILYKKARGILNKLTPQKFQTLVKQMSELEIDTEERLKGVTDHVFEKAVSEPGFSVAYASMCRYLAMIKVPSKTKQGEFVNFRAILLTRCQKEFEKDKDTEQEMERRRKEIKEAKEEEKEQLKADLEFEESKARRRSLGNIRFIGELFKLKMLTENIMHDCVFKLLKAKDLESLECLCRLLTTIGKELDSDKAKPRMEQYFQQMGKISQDKKTSSRVRFMLQDVIELRMNRWVPRRDENNPKTLDQIHKEAQREDQERQLLAQQAVAQQREQRGGGGSGSGSKGGGRRGPGSSQGGPPGGADGWATVGGRQPPVRINAERQAIDPSRLKLSRQNVDESVQLGPGGGAGRFAGWQRGSTGGGARASQEAERSSNTPSNRFSALSRSEDESRSRLGASPNRVRQQPGGFGRPNRVTPRSSQEQEREKALAAARSIIGGQTTPKEGPSRENSRSREVREEKKEPAPVATPTPAKELSQEDMEKKTISILDEFLHIQDMNEAVTCVEELNSPSTLHWFVSTSLNHVLERSEVARRQTGLLLHDLVRKGSVPVKAYINGLHEILQYAEDMEIDIPKIWQYFGELIGPMIQDGSVPFSFLKDAIEPLKASHKACVLIAAILHDASERQGHKKIASIWKSSGLQWNDFMPAADVKTFLRTNSLDFTEPDGSQPSTPTIAMPLESIQENLDMLLQEKKSTNEDIFDWIETNLDDAITKSKHFIRVLMTAVCSCAITGRGSSARVEPRDVINRGALLQKYLDHQAEFELQAVYALQSLVHKLEHPPGVLRTLFDTLYDEDIISEDAFNQWEKSEDPAEQEGKGVAMRQVVQFFTWLREAEETSDS